MKELTSIWKRNTFWQNVSWVGNIVLFLIILPYCLYKEFYGKKMNNKFKDLMIVAQQQAAKETIQNSFAYEQLVFQKFGEMIVQECAQVGEDTDGN